MAVNGPPTRGAVAIRDWASSPPGQVATDMLATCAAIEKASWQRRYLSLTCYRYMTGRPTAPGFSYAMAQRSSGSNSMYRTAEWRAPMFNGIAQVADTMSTRIFKARPFLMVTPIAGDHRARTKAKGLTRWIDGMFHELDVWDLIELCGIDAMTYGTGIIKIYETLDGKVGLKRVLPDEILINEEEAVYGAMPDFQQRVFVNRLEALARWGKKPEAERAIKNAQGVFPGFASSQLDTKNILPLCEGWSCPKPGEKYGRHVLAVGNYALEDDRGYDKHKPPFAVLKYKQLGMSWFGQGLAEQLLPLQQEANRVAAAIWENMRRMAWPRVIVDTASGVQESSLSDKSGGIIKSAAGAQGVQFINPVANGPEVYGWFDRLLKLMKERARISDTAATGTKAPGMNSGKAIEMQSQIDDAAHVDLGQRLEDFVEQIGEHLTDLGEELKPNVTLPGRRNQQIKWGDVELSKNSFSMRAFPISRLPQSGPGRQQQIDTWYADGIISKATKLRLEQVPDVEAFQDLVNASEDAIEIALDTMIETGEFDPPEPFFDLTDAERIAQSRYLLEKNEKTPQDRLDLILQWIAVVEELKGDTGPVGIQPPATAPSAAGLAAPGAPPAPPPIQSTPGMAPPVPLAA